MNRELQHRLQAELGRPGLAWKSSPRHESQEQTTMRWLPVANPPAARIELGISSDAWWVVPAPQSVTELRPDTPCVFLLPVLEVTLDEARRSLAQGLRAIGLTTEYLAVFPFDDVVATGLESSSERWAGLALKWAEQLPTSSRLQNALRSLISHGPTQKLRHAAQKLLARQRGST